jgi:hypothetical protein
MLAVIGLDGLGALLKLDLDLKDSECRSYDSRCVPADPLAPPPPKKIITPIGKPKLYHPPFVDFINRHAIREQRDDKCE